MNDRTIWFGSVFIIVCAMLAKCHDCSTSKEDRESQVNPEVVTTDEIMRLYYWDDSKKQCGLAWWLFPTPEQGGRYYCEKTDTNVITTQYGRWRIPVILTCTGLKSRGKTGTVLFSVHRDENNENAFYLKKLEDPSSVLDYWTKETRYYFWKSEADCMVSGASKEADYRKTIQ